MIFFQLPVPLSHPPAPAKKPSQRAPPPPTARLKPMVPLDRRCLGFGAAEELELEIKRRGQMRERSKGPDGGPRATIVEVVRGRVALMHPGF